MARTDEDRAAGLPEGFLEGSGRHRWRFLRQGLYYELGLHMPELPEERKAYLAGQMAARLLRDERDAFTVYAVPRT